MGPDVELRQAENVEPGDTGATAASLNQSTRSSAKGSECRDQVGRIRIAMRSREEAAGHFKGTVTRVGREKAEALNKATKPLALHYPVGDQAAKHRGKRQCCHLHEYHR